MKAVFSFWDQNMGNDAKTGYNNLGDFLYFMALSVETARKHFSEVELISNDYGIDLLKNKLGLPFTSCVPLFNGININKIFWGYTKMLAYHHQKEPFVHIDNDVFLWSGIPAAVSSKPIFFQSVEPYKDQPQYYGWYRHLIEICPQAPFFPEFVMNNIPDVAYNCGIMGANDIGLIDKWFDLSSSYVLSPDNQEWFKNPKNLLIHQNLMHEQFFVASVLKSENHYPTNGKVGLLLKDLNNASGDFKYTHAWGLVKKDFGVVAKVKARIDRDHHEYVNRIKGIYSPTRGMSRFFR